MSAAVSTHTGTGPLSLMSCVRESSPTDDLGVDCENDRNVGSKKKFWRNPRKWFKRKNNKVPDDVNSSNEIIETKETLRSRSTSELSVDEEQTRRKSGTPMHPGLSVSHDSVFHSPHSGSDLELEGAQSSSSLCYSHPHQPDLRLQTELTERLRLRRGRGDTSEDDEGLPRSPTADSRNSPTTTDVLLDKTAIKDHPTKSHSTCSEGSLVSMESSEMDEDLFGQHSSHSSKLSLQDKKTTESECDLELNNASTPLNHSAAHHRVSVRPKRTHGAPRRKRPQQLTVMPLPITPEVNEDSSVRSITPETTTIRETITELYSSKSMSRNRTMTESHLKCSSLPPGLAAPGSEGSKLSRSRSNAGTKSQDAFSILGEEDEEKEEKKTDSFLGRLFPRRSGRKKKSKEEKILTSTSVSTNSTSRSIEISNTSANVKSVYVSQQSERIDSNLPIRPHAMVRSGPAARQRIQPNDIPASPDLNTRTDAIVIPKSSPENMHSSPLQLELENHLRQRLASSLSTSPPKYTIPSSETPPESPKSKPVLSLSPPKSPIVLSRSPPKPPLPEKHHYTKLLTTKYLETREIKTEESKSKVKIAGLSSFQQRALAHNDEVDDGFKSLDLPNDASKTQQSVTKSHSFKSSTSQSKIDNRHTFTPLINQSVSENQQTCKETTEESTKTVINEYEDKCETIETIKNNNEKPISLNVDTVLKTEMEDNKDVKINEKISNLTTVIDTKDIINDFLNSGITISGPSHKAIVSIGNSQNVSSDVVHSQSKNVEQEIITNETSKEFTVKEQQISVTKIQVKRESVQVTASKNVIPEFFNVHLNKVEKPTNNVVLTTVLTAPKIVDEQNKPKTTEETPLTDYVRKFSKDDIEIIEKEQEPEPETPKHVATAIVTITTMTPPVSSRIFKKNVDNLQQRKSSVLPVNVDNGIKEKPVLKTKSSSLDMVESITSPNIDKSSTITEIKTQSVNDLSEMVNTESVSLRRKSIIKQKQEDEPELMKVFARRSLKLKDSEIDLLNQQVNKMVEESNSENKSKDSDKENQIDSPLEERRKLSMEMPKTKEPLIETKYIETTEVTLRKPSNNKLFSYQRTVSLNNPKTNELIYNKMQKQNSLGDRPKTDNWITQEIDMKDEIISSISEKSFIGEEFMAKPKNFNQRKAEWEKRAQEALKKTVP